MHEMINTGGVLEPSFHYSHAVKAGDTIYVSGQASLDASKKLVGIGDVAAQTRVVLGNMKVVLAAAGATLNDVVKVTVYVTNRDDRAAVNAVRSEYFGANKPASTLVVVHQFPIDGMLVEMDAVAVVSRRA